MNWVNRRLPNPFVFSLIGSLFVLKIFPYVVWFCDFVNEYPPPNRTCTVPKSDAIVPAKLFA